MCIHYKRGMTFVFRVAGFMVTASLRFARVSLDDSGWFLAISISASMAECGHCVLM